MRKSMFAVVGVALLSVAPVLAQKSPDVCQISIWKVKPGAAAAWAEGRKKHMEFHKQQKDAFTWYTWEVINGDRAGNFLTGTFDHYWKDFDGREAFDALDAADLAKTSGPATESSSDGYWIHLGEASRLEPAATGPSKYSQLVHYYVRSPTCRASRMLSKRSRPSSTSSPGRSTPAGTACRAAATDRTTCSRSAATATRTSLRRRRPCPVLTESMGALQATELLDDVRGSTERLYSEIIRFRPDLSYIPAAK